MALKSARRLLASMGLLALGWISPVAAQDASEFGCDRPIHLAYYEFGPLYHDGVGIDRDVIEEIARRTGCKFDTEVLPRAQIWQELQDGTLDMATSGIQTPARRRFAYFIPYIAVKNVVVVKTDIGPSIKSFGDVVAHPDWRVGVVKGYVHGPYFDYAIKTMATAGRVLAYRDQESIYQALRSGEAKVIISSSLNYGFYLSPEERQRDYTAIDVSPAPPISSALILGVTRFTPSQINALNRVTEQMYLDGTLGQIFRAHVPADAVRAMLDY